jgi:hypothetical protein
MLLVFSQVLPTVPLECTKDSVLLLLKNAIRRVRKHPKAVLLFVFMRIIFAYARDKHLLDQDNVAFN